MRYLALLLVLAACSGGDDTPMGTTRTFYIAATEMAWDYAPSGMNMITNMPFDDVANTWMQNGPQRIGRVYKKALYRGYTDDTFTTPLPVDPSLGTLGPTLHAVVGDHVMIVFKNNTAYPRSIHVHGLAYTKENEGAGYGSSHTPGDAVPSGETFTYHLDVPDRAGPGPNDGSSVLWMYHSHVDEPVDVNSGLMGAIVVTGEGKAREDGTPADVDREIPLLFEVMDENSSSYLAENIKTYTDGTVDPEDAEFQESNLKHTINGYVFGNLPGLTMKEGEHVRWDVLSMGTEVDLHTPHWHGQTVIVNGARTDVVMLLPASMIVADMVPDNPGQWLLHCHVNDHIIAGMQALFDVTP